MRVGWGWGFSYRGDKSLIYSTGGGYSGCGGGGGGGDGGELFV